MRFQKAVERIPRAEAKQTTQLRLCKVTVLVFFQCQRFQRAPGQIAARGGEALGNVIGNLDDQVHILVYLYINMKANVVIERIEIKAGDVGWEEAAPLLKAVWPPEIVATLPWRDVVWARPDQRVLVFDHANTLIGHVAIVIRNATLDGQAVKIGGIGGVATREDCRRRGVARAAVAKAIEETHRAHDADFGLLFCEPRHAPLYQKLGWQAFEGDVLVMQPRGQVRFDVTDPYVFDLKTAPRTGVLDLCGSPW